MVPAMLLLAWAVPGAPQAGAVVQARLEAQAGSDSQAGSNSQVGSDSQAGLDERAGAGFAAADAAMNAQYRATLAAMGRMDGLDAPDARSGPGYQDALLAAQRAWLAFRDAECVAEGYQFRGGSAQGMAVAGCKATLTRARTAQLKALAR